MFARIGVIGVSIFVGITNSGCSVVLAHHARPFPGRGLDLAPVASNSATNAFATAAAVSAPISSESFASRFERI
jgi:hypothetical protein